jgi:sigma-B regulation protein RsbQ
VANPDRPELAAAVVGSYRSQNADITKHFARAIFLGDQRSVLPKVKTPTLVVQTSQDIFVPEAVGHYIAKSVVNGRYQRLRATGHFPQLAGPDELAEVLRSWFVV